MGLDVASADGPAAVTERVLGRVRGPEPGPTLIGVGGLHGNEVAGISALRRVLEECRDHGLGLRGDFVGLAGNLGALAEGRRFLERDLNRSWTRDRMAGTRQPSEEIHGEDREQAELKDALDEVAADARGPTYLLDLHTTSGPAPPFTAIADTASNRAFALTIPVPLVLGFGELVDGTFFGYLTARGITSMVFEGGQHGDPGAAAASEAAVWVALAGAGLLEKPFPPRVAHARAHLRRAAEALPPVMRIIHRHAVSPGDGFRMRPGFENFQPVSTGQLLAEDRRGEVRSPGDGRLLLPLYQAQGDDGFFLIREESLPG